MLTFALNSKICYNKYNLLCFTQQSAEKILIIFSGGAAYNLQMIFQEGTEMTEKTIYLSEEDIKLLAFVLLKNPFGWKETPSTKKVILANPESLKKTRLFDCASSFKGTGHAEWEYILAGWLISAAGKSIETGDECDISQLFNTTLLASNDAYFTPKQIYNHLIHFFTIQEETKDVLKLVINVA